MKSPQYKTRNLFVASYILATGKAKFEGIETQDHKTKLFLFTPSDIAQKLETEYFDGASLPVKAIFAEYNTLKDLLFQR